MPTASSTSATAAAANSYEAQNAAVIAALDIIAEYTALGVKFVADEPRSSGWVACFAIGRTESNPSAAVNVDSGRYKDSGGDAGGTGGKSSYSLWEFAAKYGPFGNWQDAYKHYAAKAGIKIPTKRRQRNPLDYLLFEEWHAGNLRLAEFWCHKHKPGVTVDALLAAGARVAWYRCWIDKRTGQKQRGKYKCIVLPIYTIPPTSADQLVDKPTGYVAWSISGELLEVWADKKVIDHVKMKSVDGSQGALMGLHGLLAVSSPDRRSAVELIWKTAGPSDGLTLWANIPPDLRDRHIVIWNSGGEGQDVQPEMAKPFAGLDSRIVHDADATGEGGAAKWIRALTPIAPAVRHVRLPYEIQPKHGADLRQWFGEGHSYAELLEIAAQTEPAPPPDPSNPANSDNIYSADSANSFPSGHPHGNSPEQEERKQLAIQRLATFSNAVSFAAEGSGDPTTMPLRMSEILSTLWRLTDNWPRRVGSALFVESGGSGSSGAGGSSGPSPSVAWLESASSFFGWCSSQIGYVDWHRGREFVAKEECFCEVRRLATSYESVESIPHIPPLPHHFYVGGAPSSGDGSALVELLQRFSPATPLDEDLILALFATLIWGGQPGARPAFVITADKGRGVGKSKLATMLGHISGGLIDFSANEDIGLIKQRLLSPEAAGLRVALLDNVKSLKFSWAELESLITAPVISGKRMYVGDARRPNTLIWIITLNGASLSPDMAQRSVIIKLKPPGRAAAWEEETTAFIAGNKQRIIADLVAFYDREPVRLERFSRWASWEGTVLARLPEPAEVQQLILERQQVADVENEETAIIEEFFGKSLESLGYEILTDRIFLPSAVVADWYGQATGEKKTVTSICRTVGQLVNEGKLANIERNNCKTFGRGFVWIGGHAPTSSTIRTDIDSRIFERRNNGRRF